ncbi:hypothetical protein LTR10_014754 [Elasticomyces elasticus]|uniref:Pentatricopeptide repeat domain-containing protein n=1 Tax=Exophiala sideris TaxID=1016849 RepID=A0ABR0J6Z3_9EURO|nr:hypothetical protein LTR10_014754 [Elasticomyces elasticus]KAK5029399.1 hypothetical protein LTS07_005861 [Exophiala sideris]KAK5036903.1 hypothetical protein LTR13_005283 [Exophiala sideris]KAK5058029.1 hypothetical protein LTR69_007026 [Exophiala sideris]KAK5181988.1 hypothetical protein LTR44_005589 [Eurotiomycetes sp. CCFEE 6388]
MASQSPVVPSKNALRALRRLALSPPTVVIGTLGSVCGVLTLHHETRRRVHLAEQIVETKRILQSVSSGTAAARLNDMFDAAEKGEDFTLRAQHAKKRRKADGSRTFSTTAIPESDENNNLDTADQVNATDRRPESFHYQERNIHPEAIGPSFATEKLTLQDIHADVVSKIIVASKQPHKPSGHPVYGRPSQPGQVAGNQPGAVRKRPKDIAHALDSVSRRQASTLALSSLRRVVPEHASGTNGLLKSGSLKDLRNARKVVSKGFHSYSAAAFQGTSIRRSASHSYAYSETAATPREIYFKHPAVRRVRSEQQLLRSLYSAKEDQKESSIEAHPLIPKPGRSNRESTQCGDTQPEPASAEHDVNAQETPPGHFSWRPFGITTNAPRFRRWHHVRVVSPMSKEPDRDLNSYLAQADIPKSQADSEKWPSLCVADFVTRGIDEETDQALKDHLHKTQPLEIDPDLHAIFEDHYLIPRNIVEHMTKTVDPKSFVSVKTFISPSDENLTYEETLRRWLAVMRHYAQGDERHLPMAEAVFHSFRFQFEPEDIISPPVLELVRHLLATAQDSDRVQQVLFPNVVPKGLDAAAFHELAFQYLTNFCDINDDTACVQELAKVRSVASRTKLDQKLDLFKPFIQKRLRQNDADETSALTDVLQPAYEGQYQAPRIWAECALWHASHGDWNDVQAMLDLIHANGYSRRRPVHYALLFHKLLLRYLVNNNAVRSFGFLINGIKYAGLQPMHMISTTLICACVRERRFDLVSEWTSMIREAFPRVMLNFVNQKDAWRLGRALLESGASCREIANVCREISFGRREDPFHLILKDFVRELVRLDLVHRMCSIPAHMKTAGPSDDAFRAMTLPQILDHAEQFCSTQRSTSDIDTRYEIIQSEIVAQIDAFDELGFIFQGDFQLNRTPSRAVPEASDFDRPPEYKWGPVKREATSPDLPPPHWEDLPDYPELAKAVADHYTLRRNANLPVDHALLQELLLQLSITRPLDALRLVETVYASHYVRGVDGKPFENGIFLRWLELVVEAGSISSALKALWAVIDSSRHLVWTFDFATLVHMAGTVHIQKNNLRTKDWHPDHDLDYLTKRISCIRQDSPDYVEDDFSFPRWRDWEEMFKNHLVRHVSHLPYQEYPTTYD